MPTAESIMSHSIVLLSDLDDDLHAQIEQAQRAANAAQAAVPDGVRP